MDPRPAGRSWGHFVRRPRATRVRTVVLVVVVVVTVTVWVATAPASSTTSSSARATGSTGTAGTATPVDRASTSTRGVTATSVNVVFPVVSLNSLAGQEGFASDVEYGQQTEAIDLYVDAINRDGGIDGRRIRAMIVPYDPASESEMRALCKTWTEGSPPAASPSSTGSVRGRGTTSCVSPRRATPPSWASGPR